MNVNINSFSLPKVNLANLKAILPKGNLNVNQVIVHFSCNTKKYMERALNMCLKRRRDQVYHNWYKNNVT